LGKCNDDIDSITMVIKYIAVQADFLVLNAAIEAARARKQDRSFAVVADEVHQLAKSTLVATEEIKNQ
jgi:methyl-accepting chemotaxis protein